MSSVIIKPEDQAAPNIDPRIDTVIRGILTDGETPKDQELSQKFQRHLEAKFPGFRFAIEVVARSNKVVVRCPMFGPASAKWGIFLYLSNVENDYSVLEAYAGAMLEAFGFSRVFKPHEFVGRAQTNGMHAFDPQLINKNNPSLMPRQDQMAVMQKAYERDILNKGVDKGPTDAEIRAQNERVKRLRAAYDRLP